MTPASNAPRTSHKLGAALALTATADLLLYERDVGVSLALFAALLAAAVAALHWPMLKRWQAVSAGIGGIGALLPLVVNVSPLSVLMALAGVSIFALAVSGRLRGSTFRILRQVPGFLLATPFRALPDHLRFRRAARRRPGRRSFSWLAAWLVPVGLSAVFIVLFGLANPIVEQWLELIDLWALLDMVRVGRIVFWLFVLATVWGFLRPRIAWFQRLPWRRTKTEAIGPAAARRAQPFGEVVFGRAAVLRALTLFNALFAVETALDIAYLWGGVELPDGMTYADYAHRGAYPLIVTALLSAGFVLIATRPGSASAESRGVRWLVYLWTGQNVMLVVSSILRLDLYVDAYSLTYWRVAAFVWMGLVAAGLIFIIARIALGKSNEWLLAANLLTLSATLYACGFINFAGLIAEYNVSHRPAAGDTTIQLDSWYLIQLGPSALPAIDRLLAEEGERAENTMPCLAWNRERLAAEHWRTMQDWRAWTLRGWLLSRYLAAHPRAPALMGHQGAAMRSPDAMHRILVADDDPHIREVICFALQKAGMAVQAANDGPSALKQFEQTEPSLIVLDVGMPGMDGLEVCRLIRRTSDVPILFLSARDEEIDRVLGLEIGGDDYVTKPFSPRELVARVNAILRRPRTGEDPAAHEPVLRGRLKLDPERQEASFDGKTLTLTALEFAILKAFVTRPSRVHSRDQIMSFAYVANIHVSDRTIDSHIRNIRGKLASVGCGDAIETVHGVGFRIGRCGA